MNIVCRIDHSYVTVTIQSFRFILWHVMILSSALLEQIFPEYRFQWAVSEFVKTFSLELGESDEDSFSLATSFDNQNSGIDSERLYYRL